MCMSHQKYVIYMYVGGEAVAPILSTAPTKTNFISNIEDNECLPSSVSANKNWSAYAWCVHGVCSSGILVQSSDDILKLSLRRHTPESSSLYVWVD